MATKRRYATVVVAVMVAFALLFAFAPKAEAHNGACPSEPIHHDADLVPIWHGTNFQCNPVGPDSFNCGTSKVWLELKSAGFGPLDSTGRFQVRTTQGDGSTKLWLSGQRETDHRGIRINTGFQHLVFVRAEVLDTSIYGYSIFTIGCQSGGASVTYFSW